MLFLHFHQIITRSKNKDNLKYDKDDIFDSNAVNLQTESAEDVEQIFIFSFFRDDSQRNENNAQGANNFERIHNAFFAEELFKVYYHLKYSITQQEKHSHHHKQHACNPIEQFLFHFLGQEFPKPDGNKRNNR